MTIKCCKDCEDRHLGCHDTCQRYIQERTKGLEARLEMKKQNRINSDLSQMKRGKVRKRKSK